MAENFDWEKVCVSKFCTVCADFVNYEKTGQETGSTLFWGVLLWNFLYFPIKFGISSRILWKGNEGLPSITSAITVLWRVPEKVRWRVIERNRLWIILYESYNITHEIWIICYASTYWVRKGSLPDLSRLTSKSLCIWIGNPSVNRFQRVIW